MKSTFHDCVRRCDGPAPANAREGLPLLPSLELRIDNRNRPIPHLSPLNAPPGRDPKERRASCACSPRKEGVVPYKVRKRCYGEWQRKKDSRRASPASPRLGGEDCGEGR